MSINLFFEFLKVAIGNRETLSGELSDNDWQDIFLLLKKHALLGVGFTAVERLHIKGIVCPAKLRMQWYAMVVQIEKRNVQLNAICKKVTEQYEHDGLSTCILKGQGNLLNYPNGLGARRQSGDIDVWATTINDCGIPIAVETGKNTVDYIEYHGHKAVREYVRMLYRLQGLSTKPKACYHHIDAPDMDGVEVEVHYRPTFCRSFFRNRRMQKWFTYHAPECMNNRTSECFAVPTASFNVIYQMAHLFEHYFEGGIGLRHMMDYYFTLQIWQKAIMDCKNTQSQGMWSEGLGTPVMSKEEVMAVLRSFGMSKFTAAVMYVLHEAFENEECCSADRGSERELKEINRELKEICPQADGVGEQQLTAIGQQLKEIGPQADDRSERECPQIYSHIANIKKSSSSSASFREFKKNIFVPWMICVPNEVEGKRLLAEIMQGGNFGQYDTRDAALKKGGMMKHGVWKLKRVMRLVSSYPEEALWEPVFRVYHLLWRGING